MYIMEMHVYIIETHVHIMEMHMYIMEMHLHICMWDAYARLVERSEPHAGGLDRRWVAAMHVHVHVYMYMYVYADELDRRWVAAMHVHVHVYMYMYVYVGGLDRRWVAAGLARGRALLARAECLRSVHVASKGESFHHRPAYICMCMCVCICPQRPRGQQG